jgi:hypothetical protein
MWVRKQIDLVSNHYYLLLGISADFSVVLRQQIGLIAVNQINWSLVASHLQSSEEKQQKIVRQVKRLWFIFILI